jgi:cytochrome c peroxidase
MLTGRIAPLLLASLVIIEGGSLLLSRAPAHAEQANTLESEIAQVETRVDRYESAALAQAAKTVPGSPQRIVVLGKVLYYDKNLSVNRNTACAFCHMPETGFQGAIETINKSTSPVRFAPASALASRRLRRMPHSRRRSTIARAPVISWAEISGICARPACG